LRLSTDANTPSLSLPPSFFEVRDDVLLPFASAEQFVVVNP